MDAEVRAARRRVRWLMVPVVIVAVVVATIVLLLIWGTVIQPGAFWDA